jgi:hypothetical protein
MRKNVTAVELLVTLTEAEEFLKGYAVSMAEMQKKGELKEGAYEKLLTGHKVVMGKLEELRRKIDEKEKEKKGEVGH